MDDREKKKQMILENAINVFSKEGFEGTDVEEIAKLSNVGKGTVYRYFGNKEQLFVESFLYTVNMFKSETERVLKSDLPIKEKIDNLIEQSMRRLKEKEQLLRLYTLDISKIARIFAKKRSIIPTNKINRMAIITDFIREGQEKGVIINAISAESLASMILGSIQQVLGMYYIGLIKEFSEVERRIKEIMNFYKSIIIKEEL